MSFIVAKTLRFNIAIEFGRHDLLKVILLVSSDAKMDMRE